MLKRPKATLTKGRKDMQGWQENIRAQYITPSVDNQDTTPKSFASYVASAAKLIQDADYITARTVISFNSSHKVADETSFEADERNIREWFTTMVRKGISPVTLRRYLGKLHSIYSDYKGITDEGEELFSELRDALANKNLWQTHEKDDSINIVANLALKVRTLPGAKATIAKEILYLFYSCAASYSTIAELRFDDSLPAIEQIKDIVDSMPKERRTYVFPLRHGRVRSPQLSRDISREFSGLLADLGFRKMTPFAPDTILGWWIEAALKCGFSNEDIISVIPAVPHDYEWLKLVKPRLLSEEEKTSKFREVANLVGDLTPRWYAMFMRDNHTPDDIMERLRNENPAMVRDFHTFYPTHKVVKHDGGRKTTEVEPFLPHILFFKTRPDAVRPIFDTIGDLAWCFRVTNRKGAPYAVIPKREMDNFQTCIGVLDESVKMEFVQNPELVPDRRIRITGGAFKGYEGTIYKQNGTVEDSDMRYFILRINDQNNIVWKVRIEEGFIEPIKEEQ